MNSKSKIINILNQPINIRLKTINKLITLAFICFKSNNKPLPHDLLETNKQIKEANQKNSLTTRKLLQILDNILFHISSYTTNTSYTTKLNKNDLKKVRIELFTILFNNKYTTFKTIDDIPIAVIYSRQSLSKELNHYNIDKSFIQMIKPINQTQIKEATCQ